MFRFLPLSRLIKINLIELGNVFDTCKWVRFSCVHGWREMSRYGDPLKGKASVTSVFNFVLAEEV